MKTINNVVDFSDLCIFAEKQNIAFYNAAHDALIKDAYPYPEDNSREIYLSEMEYARNELAGKILTEYMKSKDVKYITVMK